MCCLAYQTIQMYRNYLKKIGIDRELYRRIWFIMRLTTFLLLVTFMQVSASSFAQKVSLRHTNSSLKVIFKELKAQTGYNFLYTERLLQKANPVNIQVSDKELDQVLQQLFVNQPLTYEIDSKTVVIREKTRKKKELVWVNKEELHIEEQQSIRGRVVNEKDEPLVGATLVLHGKDFLTSENGVFDFPANVGDQITVNFIGYQSRIITIENFNPMTIRMSPQLEEMEDVVVTALGLKKAEAGLG